MTTTSRWQRKWERDHLTDGWSPIPTQIVSRRTARRSSRGPSELLVQHHAALDLALEERVVGEVHVGQRHAARDQLLQLVLAAHEHVDEHGHVGALVAGAERRAREHALLQEE